jgi:hypothetical protein
MGSLETHKVLCAATQQEDGSWLHNDGDVYWYNELSTTHREDGPAIIRSCGKIFLFYLNGRPYEFEEWCAKIDIDEDIKLMLRLQYG